MKSLLACLLFAAASVTYAQDVTATVVNSSNAESPLASPYVFTTTPEGSSASISIRLRDSSSNKIMIAAVTPATTQSASAASSDFTITGLTLAKVLNAGETNSFDDFTLTFAPQETGLLTAYLQVTYQIQENGCDFTSQSPAQQCTSNTALLAIVQGDASAPQIVLSYQSSSGQVTLQPNSTSPLDFGNVSTSLSQTYTFTLTNQTSGALATPAVTLQTAVYDTTAFSIDTSALASTIPALGTTTFTVKFAPGQAAQSQATLKVGTNAYPLAGTGVILSDFDALVINYVDSTGVRLLAQGSSPIDFGSLTVGGSSGNVLTFIVTNPTSSFGAVTIPSIAVTGTGFTISTPLTTPVSVAPGQSVSFGVTFASSSAGTYSGTLAIGSRQFSLTGKSTNPAFDLSLSVDLQPLASQQQAHVSVQSSTAAGTAAIGQLSMTFTPSVSGVTDDPAIAFTATSGRELQVTLAQGTQTATYNGQSAITFQTGTTAGTITFSLTFPNQPVITKSFTITPAKIQLSSGSAVRQSPNLLVTVTGFDNSYTAGSMAFTFYNTSGQQINATPITVDATNQFQTYFLTQSKAGGSFSAQASFPVTGDTSQVGSVQIALSNSAGTSTVTQTFQ